MKDQGSVYQRMHCPRIYYLILFQCDIFQITYSKRLRDATIVVQTRVFSFVIKKR